MQKLHDDLKRAGFHPFHAPCGIMLNEAKKQDSRCIRCNTCDGFPCLVEAKSDAEMIGVRPALSYPNVTLIRNAMVTQLKTNAAGNTVTEVIATVEGKPETFLGSIVVVSF